jgi:hypothetical protein
MSDKLTNISTRNVLYYTVLGLVDGKRYVIHPFYTIGFVFNELEVLKNEQFVTPLARFSLNDKQIVSIRVAIGQKDSIIFTWYELYKENLKGTLI